jgi:5-methyltetrahydropteroyltriglutamate--homocysteine methyltransferase
VVVGLKTTTVGWFPKPVEVRRARWRLAEGEIEASELHTVEARATDAVLTLQEELGLDVLVDGQIDREDTVGFFGQKLEGMEPAGLVRCFGNRYYRKPRIVGNLSRAGTLTVDVWSRAQQATTKPVKAVLTGPYTLMDWSFDEHYGSRGACCRALAEIVRDEAQDLLAAGAQEIQIDEPAISARPDEMDLVAETLGLVTAPLSGKARTWVHIAYGDLLPVIDRVLTLPVDGLLLEMVSSNYAVLDRLQDLPENKLLGAGVVDVHSAEIESTDTLRARVDRLLQQVSAERLWLIPDSGLRTLSTDVAKAKLQAIVDIATKA